MRIRRAGGRGLGRTAASALVLVGLLGGAGPALAASPQADRSAQVQVQAQAMLDRVLGPGNAVVQITATVQAGGGATSSVSWGAAVPSSIAVAQQRVPGGTTVDVGRVDAVDRSVTTTVTPAGTLVRQSVAVAVDRTAARGISTARLRGLVAAAVGLTPSRGDRLSVLRAAFPHPAVPAAPRASWVAAMMPFAVPGIEVGGGAVALLIVLTALRGRNRRSRSTRVEV